jgi:competence protein ComEC
MRRLVVASLLCLVATAPALSRGALEIFFIDVEGGAATLMVTPAGESVLMDAGYGGRFGSRDPERILEAMREARIDRIDYLVISHFHNDHVGGVPELATKVPIGTFVDYGAPMGTDRMSGGAFRAYEPVRLLGRHLQAQAGDRLPFTGIAAQVVSAGGSLLSAPLEGAGQSNAAACANAEDHVEDGTENHRSVGVMFRFGKFSFLNLGDLSGNTLTRIVCPTNLLGTVSAYLVSHHGDYDTSVPALYEALRPRVAIMNNGVTKGGSPAAFKAVRAAPGLEDLWQLHASLNPGAWNAPDPFVANVDDGLTGHWLRLTATDDGSFQMVNPRTGFSRTYAGN